jgi:hypothetical protein
MNIKGIKWENRGINKNYKNFVGMVVAQWTEKSMKFVSGH